MQGKLGQLGILLAILMSQGCATCHHKAIDLTHQETSYYETPTPQRNRVHIFVFNGADILDCGGMSGLRNEINSAGFTQAYYGYACHYFWFASEMKRIAKDDPEARFVMIGYDVGALPAVGLANDAKRYGWNLDGVFLLDPVGVSASSLTTFDIPASVIQSEQWNCTLNAGGDSTTLPETGHFGVPSHKDCTARIVETLKLSSLQIPDDSRAHMVLPLIDDPAPLPTIIPSKDVDSAVKRTSYTENPWVPVQQPQPRR